MRRYGILIIGTGRIAAVHALSVHRNPALELKGFVNSLDPGDLPHQWGVPCHATFTEAIESLQPDGLVIASPTATHPDYIAETVRYALPALCEKPIALHRNSAEQAVMMVKRANLPVILGFHRRFDPHRREVKERIAAGEIGRVHHILLLSRDDALPDRSVMRHQGGIVADMVVHDLDELLWLVGRPPERVRAKLDRLSDEKLAEIGDYDTAALQLEWTSGQVAHISASRQTGYGFEQRLEVFGSDGRLICTDPRVTNVVADRRNGTLEGLRQRAFADRYRDAYQAEIDHLADLIRGLGKPICSLEDGLHAMDLVERVQNASADAFPDVHLLN